MRIGARDLDDEVLIVAEIGNNHEGSVSLAEDLIGLAAEAGADAVKFQTVHPERLVSVVQRERLAQLQRFCLPDDAWQRLSNVATEAGVMFLSTPFSMEAVRLLDPLVPGFKIASGDNDFALLLRAVASTGKPVILSTGLTDLQGVARAKAVIEDVWARVGLAPGIVLLQCVVAYPTPAHDANLLAIRGLARLGATVGYSDHTIGIEAAVLSIGVGARLIEKHFTIDKAYSDFRDHQLSADPADMREMVDRIRTAEQLLGSVEKRLLAIEEPMLPLVRRGAIATASLDAGHILVEDDVAFVRPAGPVSAAEADLLLGRKLVRAVAAGEQFDLTMVQGI